MQESAILSSIQRNAYTRVRGCKNVWRYGKLGKDYKKYSNGNYSNGNYNNGNYNNGNCMEITEETSEEISKVIIRVEVLIISTTVMITRETMRMCSCSMCVS